MPEQYKYRGLASDGQTHEGVITATSEEAVIEFLRDQQLTPIRVNAASRRSGLSMWGFFRSRQYEELIAFTNTLRTLYRAGVPLLRALSVIRVGSGTNPFNQAINRIRLSVQSGHTLSGAIAEHRSIFPPIYSVSIAAGEESGKLDDVLDQLGTVLREELELTRQIKAGIRYPVMVICAIVAAFIVLLAFVVPRFVAFYSAFDAELPIFTRLLIGTSELFSSYWPIGLGLLVAGTLGIRKAALYPLTRAVMDRWMLGIPIIGDLIVKGSVARFALMFRTLLRSGLPLVRSLDILIQTIKNSAIAAEVSELRDLLQSGRDAELLDMKKTYMPDLALHMMSIGLESGSLDTLLKELGDHYGKEVRHTSRQLTALLEPLLTLIMGVFVLLLALAIFLPMWNLIQVFKGQ